jgi:L-ascorbate metabolism protein UlaG (beta-lactamase superfamily)
MNVIWNGHSCFSIQTQGQTIVFDPYVDDCVPGLVPLRLQADGVFCSHGHRDHNATELVTLSGRGTTVPVEAIPVFHDRVRGLRRGRNTIHLLESEGLRLAHLGDLGHIPSKAVQNRLHDLDALLIPVGGYYTINAPTAQRLIELLKPKVVIPMHYRLGDMGYPVLDELSRFSALRRDVVAYDTNTLMLTQDTQPQTALLTYAHG